MIYLIIDVPEELQMKLAYGIVTVIAVYALIWAGYKLLTFLRRRGGRARSRRRA